MRDRTSRRNKILSDLRNSTGIRNTSGNPELWMQPAFEPPCACHYSYINVLHTSGNCIHCLFRQGRYSTVKRWYIRGRIYVKESTELGNCRNYYFYCLCHNVFHHNVYLRKHGYNRKYLGSARTFQSLSKLQKTCIILWISFSSILTSLSVV